MLSQKFTGVPQQALKVSPKTGCFRAQRSGKAIAKVQSKKLDVQQEVKEIHEGLKQLAVPIAGLALPLMFCESVQAAQGEYGIFEGRILSVTHPIIMGLLFTASLGAAYTGLQHRRSREVGELIREKKRLVPAKSGEEGGTATISPVEQEIQALEADRKWLVDKRFKDRHWGIGSVLLGGGVTFSIYGALNTYLRLGKLFPGPHLFAGAGVVSTWAIAASLVPEMQKGNNAARTAHITLNFINIALFAWQIPTGWAILEKVLQNTQFP